MKIKILPVLCGLALISGQVAAQRSCGAEQVKQQLIAKYPQAANFFAQKAQYIEAQEAAYEAIKQKTTATVTIPVVFHIVLNQTQINALGGTSGIRQRVLSQMETINEDYAKLNTDVSLVPAVFQPLAAASNIRFGLAHRKPDGTGTEGFEIATITASDIDINTGSAGSTIGGSDAKYTSTGGLASWNHTRYLNIWVINPGGASGLLGLTLPPSFVSFGYPAEEVGVVINYGAFGRRTGSQQYFISGIDKGRTLTHEIGHFFELNHVWADNNGCPPSSPDDGIADTPPQQAANYGCPSFPKISCSNGPNGDMFMNYMDYVNDACMQMFTQGQVNVMNAMVVSGGESFSLTQGDDLLQWPTGINELSVVDFNISPNPSKGLFTIDWGTRKDAQAISIYNMMGQQVKKIALNPSNSYTIDLTALPKGVYGLQCTFANGIVTRKIVLE